MMIRKIILLFVLLFITVVSVFSQTKPMNEISKWTEGSSASWTLDVFQSVFIK